MDENQQIEEQPKTKRPVGVWIITIFQAILLGSTLLIMIFPRQVELDSFHNILLFFSLVSAIIGLIATVQLFCLKANAFWLYILSNVVALIQFLILGFLGKLTNYLKISGFSFNNLIITYSILAVILIYICHLKNEKILT